MKRTLKNKEYAVKTKQEKARNDIAYIKRILEDSEKVFVENGVKNIMWGTLVAIGQLITYILVRKENSGIMADSMPAIIAVWVVTLAVLWLIIIILFRRQFNTMHVKSFAGRIFASIWIAMGIGSAICIFVILSTNVINPYLIDPIVSLFIGAAYFSTSVILSGRWMKLLALGWWGGSIPMFLYPSENCFLIFSTMIVLFAIVPGIGFYIRHKSAETRLS